MGLLLAAMAGAGDAGVQSMNQEIEQIGRKELLEQQSQAQLQNSQALEKYKIELADQVRQRDAEDLNAARAAEETRMLNERIAKGRGANAGEFDPASITPEERARYALEDKDRALALRNAGLQTGQLSAKDAAVLDNKDGALEAHLAVKMQEIEFKAAIGQARAEAIAAKGANGTEVRVGEGYLNAARDLAKQIEMMPDSNPQKQAIQLQIKDLQTKALDLFGRAVGGQPAPSASGGKQVPNPMAFDRSAKADGTAWTQKLTDIASAEGLTPAQTKFFRAMTGVESSNGKNTKDSVDGAIGPGQMMPDTFKRFARSDMPDIRDPDHNLHAAARYVKFLGDKAGDDTARMAVGYQSGEGNINPKGDTPWIEDRQDGLGTKVSQYVAKAQARIKEIEDADAKATQTAAPAAKPAPAQAATPPGDTKKPLPPALRDSDVDARVAKADRARKDAEAKAAWEAEAKAREKAARRDEVAGLTLERIKQLNPREAQQILSQYQDVIDPSLARELRRRL